LTFYLSFFVFHFSFLLLLLLLQDVTETRHDTTKPILDHTHSLARRIGLAQLPLACIVTRFMQDVWIRLMAQHQFTFAGQQRLFLSGFGCLLLLKILTGIVLAGVSAEHRIHEETSKANQAEARAEERKNRRNDVKKQRAPSKDLATTQPSSSSSSSSSSSNSSSGNSAAPSSSSSTTLSHRRERRDTHDFEPPPSSMTPSKQPAA
jgi:hypothetical protein